MNKFDKKYGNKQINKTMGTSINREQIGVLVIQNKVSGSVDSSSYQVLYLHV